MPNPSTSSGRALPTGTVTFLFTDIEGSTQLAQQFPDALPAALARHHAILREAIESHHGHVFQIIGDAFCAAFATAPNALAATRVAQRALHTEPWGATGPIRVRMGVHTGEAEWRDGAYHGYLTQTRVQRVMLAGHGGQILLSQTTHDLIRDQLAPDISLRDLGEHRLKGLARLERIFQVVAPDLPSDFPSLQTLNAIPHNLPIQLTSFVGREKEIAEVKRLLSTTRLLTLTGVGGTGKTRLSLQVAADMLDTFKDGAWLIELAPLADPNLVPNTVASVLGVREAQGRALLATLSDYLHAKNLLLILDNCEHLLEACAQFADAILRICPNVRLLASSREALGIAGEQAFHVPSLGLPPHSPEFKVLSAESNRHSALSTQDFVQYEAVRLFLDRACAVKSDFALTNANASAIAQICYRLDGIPLAIELAAARVKALRVEQIAARLDDRFRLLTGGSRTALPRQQTLRSTIDWSHSLLTEAERVLLRRLSVFAGGWTLEAAEAVCADDVGAGLAPAHTGQPQGLPLHQNDILDLLTRLVDKSLVVVDDSGDGEVARYWMLETIRQYAREKLADVREGEHVRDQHLAYFAQLAEEAEPKFQTGEQVPWLNQLEAELDNVRIALDWSTGGAKIEMGLRLAAALYDFWYLRGHQTEGIETLQNLIERPEAAARTLVRAKALNVLSPLYMRPGDYHQAKIVAHEALAIGQALRDTLTIARALLCLGVANANQGNAAEAQGWLEQSLALYRALGDKQSESTSLLTLGISALRVSEYEHAQAWLAEAVALERTLGDKLYLTASLRNWGFALFHLHDQAGAIPKFRESLTLNVELGDRQGVAACLAAYAAVALAREQFERAVQLFGAAEVLLESIRTKMMPYDHDQYTRNVATLRAQLSEATFAKAWAEGRALTMEQAINIAMSDER